MRVMGVDPGGRGALALIVDSKLSEWADMPINMVRRGKTDKPEVDVWALNDLLAGWLPDVCYMEKVASHPGDSPMTAFSFGRAAGACEALVRTCGGQFWWAPPVVWKRAMKLINAGKDGSIVLATNLFPDHAMAFRQPKVQGEGRAEAALIAEYGRRVEAGELPR